MRIRLKERRSEATEVISFVFDLSGQPFEHQPGQYVFCGLDPPDFPNERGNGPHFTISSSPTDVFERVSLWTNNSGTCRICRKL